MYIIKIKNGETEKVLHELDVNSVRRAAAFTFSRGINEKQKASITVYPQNPVYDEIYEKKTIIEIINSHTGEVDFEGCVREIQDSGMNSDGVIGKKLICDGYLAYLEETVQPYKVYNGAPADTFLMSILAEHNRYTSEDKHITLGACNITSTGNFTTEYGSTLDEIQRNLIDSFGGEVQIRRNASGNLVLDYMTQIGTVKNTKVELAENMVALNVSNDTSGIVTRLFPLGPTLNDNTGARMTIESINDGKPYIDSTEGIETYGIIQSTVDYSGDGDFETLASLEKELADDTKKKETAEKSRAKAIIKRDQATSETKRQKYNQKIAELDAQISAYTARITALTDTLIPAARTTALTSIKTKAEQYLANNCRIKKSYRAVVLDLSTIGEDEDSFREGNTYRFINRLVPIDEDLRVMRVAIDGYKPYSPTVEIGDKAATITNIAARAVKLMEYEMPKQKNEILESAKETATALIQSGLNGYVVINENEICIMDTPDKATATKVWRWNQGGFGYSDTGYDGLYGTAITMDGAIVADFITAGVLRGIEITNGNGTFHVSKDGTCTANTFNSNNANITGGRININTSSESYDVINLNSGGWKLSISPLQLELKNKEEGFSIRAQAGAIYFKDANGVKRLIIDANGLASFSNDSGNAVVQIDSKGVRLWNDTDGWYSVAGLLARIKQLENAVFN